MHLSHWKKLSCLVLCACMLAGIMSGCSSGDQEKESNSSTEAEVSGINIDTTPETAEGIAYLLSLEDQDITEIQNILQEQHDNNFALIREEKLAQLENGEVSCWSLFEDYLICGDSRCVAFTHYELLPESNVFAKDGATIRDLENMLSQVVNAAPARLFLCYGMNDFCSGKWSGYDEWTAEYTEVIHNIQAQLPNTRIYVCSIIPATKQMTEEQPLWTVIYKYNTALEEAINSIDGCCYIDLTEIGESHQDLYLDDGKHFVKEFYDYWGTALIMAMYDFEADSDENSDYDINSGNDSDSEEESEDKSDSGTNTASDPGTT